jgi:hypothetical protein
MFAPFDPYHRWLGISPKDQPPDHYRLLGIDRFEADPEVIRDAAERQMGHVRRYALGPQRDLSQKILNELGAAKACLLNPKKKAAHDERLRANVAPANDARLPDPPAARPPVTEEPAVASAGSLRDASEIASEAAWLETLGTPMGQGTSPAAAGNVGDAAPGHRPPPRRASDRKAARVVAPRQRRRTLLDALLPRRLDVWLASVAGQHGTRLHYLLRAAALASPLVAILVVVVLLATLGSPPPRAPVEKPAAPPLKPVPAPVTAIAPFDAKQARGSQLQWAKHLNVPVVQTNSIGMEFCWSLFGGMAS